MLLALASILSLQLEAGGVAMQHAPDDIYYDAQEPHKIKFNTAAYGAGLRWSTERVQWTVGYRNLGYTVVEAGVLQDQDYFACRPTHSCGAPIQQWRSEGNERQLFTEVGYAFHLGSYRLVPSVGIAEATINWHATIVSIGEGHFPPPGITLNATSKTDHMALPFAGLTLQRGNAGVGLYWLDTGPNTDVYRDGWYAGQGKSAWYARFTYAIPVLK